MAPQGKVLAAKNGDLNSVPGTHIVEGENSQKLSSDPHIMMGLHTHTPHKYNKKLNRELTKNKIIYRFLRQVTM